MGRKKQEEKKKRIELNVIRMNSQYITKKRRKSMIDRMCVCLLHYAFSNILKKKKKEERRKRQNIDFNIISSHFSSLYIEYQ
jgi:hypothetical protein